MRYCQSAIPANTRQTTTNEAVTWATSLRCQRMSRNRTSSAAKGVRKKDTVTIAFLGSSDQAAARA